MHTSVAELMCPKKKKTFFQYLCKKPKNEYVFKCSKQSVYVVLSTWAFVNKKRCIFAPVAWSIFF